MLFILFIKFIYINNSIYSLFLCALFLGISTFIRAANFPLIFLSLPIIISITIFHDFSRKKIIFCSILFLIIALMPVSNRWFNNIIYNETFSLTSQAGSHAAYWIVPGILNISKNMDRSSAIKYINMRIDNEERLIGNNYKDSKTMLNISKDIIFEQSLLHLSYAWVRSSLLNIATSSVLLDSRVRNLNHPSFAKAENITEWTKKLFLEKDNLVYGRVLLASLIFSIFTALAFIIGLYYSVRENIIISVLSVCIIVYFCLITGPVISPKYCLPFLPIIIYFQSITLERLFYFINNRNNS